MMKAVAPQTRAGHASDSAPPPENGVVRPGRLRAPVVLENQ